MSLKHDILLNAVAEFFPRFSITRVGNPISSEIEIRPAIAAIATLLAGGASIHPPAQLVSAGAFEAFQLIVTAKAAANGMPGKKILTLTIHTDLEDHTAMTDQAAIAYAVYACAVRIFVDQSKLEAATKKEEGATDAAPSPLRTSGAAATETKPGEVVSFEQSPPK